MFFFIFFLYITTVCVFVNFFFFCVCLDVKKGRSYDRKITFLLYFSCFAIAFFFLFNFIFKFVVLFALCFVLFKGSMRVARSFRDRYPNMHRVNARKSSKFSRAIFSVYVPFVIFSLHFLLNCSDKSFSFGG